MSNLTKDCLGSPCDFINGMVKRGMSIEQAEFLAKYHEYLVNAHISSRVDLYNLSNEVKNKSSKTFSLCASVIGNIATLIAIIIVLV